jgi:hypothetical protein
VSFYTAIVEATTLKESTMIKEESCDKVVIRM